MAAVLCVPLQLDHGLARLQQLGGAGQVGGQGGGVLTNWIVELAESQGFRAQATSVAGVAQRTGATIFLDTELAPGEILTIDCQAKTVASSYRINAINAILPGSQFGRFALLPGNNPISLMTNRITDVTASVAYTNRYWSNDV
jgi:indolepyruvate ferredoxin oxidoreductase beta subunit